jgi:stage V sporulation protein S
MLLHLNIGYIGLIAEVINTIIQEVIMSILKVSSKSSPNSVAGAIAGVIREKGSAEIQAIGAGAINQSVKAIAIARGFVSPSGIDLITIPAFTDIVIDGEERTAIKFIIEPRRQR